MKNFDKKSLIELKKLSLEEVKKYYLELRKYEFENNVPLKGIEIRKKIHKLLYTLIKIDRILSKEKLTVIGNKSHNTDKTVIYACTHIGGNDIQRTFEAIKEHAYLFLGDPEGIYQDLTGVILHMNGAICLETRNKEDRHIAKERAVELLNRKGNLLIYPEGAWNITENLPVMKLYNGAIKMALETNSEIVPVAIEQYDNQFYVNIGENIYFNKDFNIDDMNKQLRDTLATLKWDIFEYNGINNRNTITEELKNSFQQNIIDKCEYGFTTEDVYETMYKDSNEVASEEVYAPIKKIVPNKNNAFLFDKHLKDSPFYK